MNKQTSLNPDTCNSYAQLDCLENIPQSTLDEWIEVDDVPKEWLKFEKLLSGSSGSLSPFELHLNLKCRGDGTTQIFFEERLISVMTWDELLATGSESHLVMEDDDVVGDCIDEHMEMNNAACSYAEMRSFCGHYAPTGGCQSFYKH